MMKSRVKRIMLQMTMLLLFTAGLYGCGRDGEAVSDPEGDTGGQQKKQALGRYAEQEVSMPEGVTFGSVISFRDGPDGKPMLFVKQDNKGAAEFTAYLLSEDLTWEEKECGWLNQLGLDFESADVGIAFGEDQKLYAVYSEQTEPDKIGRHHVVVSEDWKNGREIQIPVLEETNEYGYVYYPNRVTALENGNLLFDSGMRLYLYDSEGQRRLAELSNEGRDYFVHGNQFYLIDEHSGSLVRYEGENGTEQARYPLEMEQYYGARAAESENGDLSVMSQDGIQLLKNGSGIWEQVIEGKRNTMGSPKYYPAGFVEGGQGDYFVYYGSMDEISKLAHYVYDPDMPVEPETELTIFSLYDNLTIRQAISEFQIGNPDVKIDFKPVMEEGGSGTSEDYIRTLNTELLAGKGPDILILDGISEGSYIEKGILADITDEVEALVSSGDFLENLADGSRVDGRIYSVPVRIGLPLTFGRKGVLAEAGDPASLAGLVGRYETGQIFGTVNREAFLSFYSDVFLSSLVDGQGSIREQELKDFLLSMKQILDGSRISDGSEGNWPTSVWGLLEKGTYLYSGEIKGFFTAEEGTSVLEQAEGELESDMITLNRTYFPYGTIGINQAGENKETAIRFLRTALSEDVQRSDFYDGFPVSRNALEFLCGIERNTGDGYGGTINGTDGRTYEMRFVWPSEPQRRKLAEFCKAANRSAGKNREVKQIFSEYTKDYFDGRASLEETVEQVLSKITIHIQE